jgi:hypothetical protein
VVAALEADERYAGIVGVEITPTPRAGLVTPPHPGNPPPTGHWPTSLRRTAGRRLYPFGARGCSSRYFVPTLPWMKASAWA